MIARIWRGVTEAAQADQYLDYLQATGIPEYRATPGNQGAWMLRRIVADRAEFITLTFWDSLDAVRAFAGDDSAYPPGGFSGDHPGPCLWCTGIARTAKSEVAVSQPFRVA